LVRKSVCRGGNNESWPMQVVGGGTTSCHSR
jgi:hypothetical protein